MKIFKLGHCCLLIETKGVRIMTDPGVWNEYREDLIKNIDAILITHEHSDHLHTESIQKLLQINPNIQIYTNKSAGVLLQQDNINFNELGENGELNIKDVTVKYFQCAHAEVYNTVTPVLNTPLFIDNTLFYPGDSFYPINESVKILALPIAGPWLKLADAIDYAKSLKPEYAFPVHDGMLKHLGSTHILPEKVLNERGIKFKAMLAGDILEVD